MKTYKTKKIIFDMKKKSHHQNQIIYNGPVPDVDNR